MSNPQEEPDWQWLEDSIVGFFGLCLAILTAFVTIFVNLVSALCSTGDDNDSTDE